LNQRALNVLLLSASLAIVGIAAAGISRGFFGWPQKYSLTVCKLVQVFNRSCLIVDPRSNLICRAGHGSDIQHLAHNFRCVGFGRMRLKPAPIWGVDRFHNRVLPNKDPGCHVFSPTGRQQSLNLHSPTSCRAHNQ